MNAVLALGNGAFATGGDDGHVMLWTSGKQAPVRILQGHDSPVSALALSPSGLILASAGWEGDIRLWPTNSQTEPSVLKGHAGQVTVLAYTPGGTLISGGYDATVRFWRNDQAVKTVQLESPINKLAILGDTVVAACADGRLRILTLKGEASGEIELSGFPIVALAASPASDLVAAGSIDGRVILVDPIKRSILREHQGRGWPVWALAFSADGRQFFSGGGDGLVRRWDTATGELVAASIASAQEILPEPLRHTRGAEVFRACVACHTLRDDDAPRAGPSLHGVIGRHIASAPNYAYSDALRTLDIVWSRDTIARLFEVGPHAYTPGTKMPEQRLNPADRQALVDFLDKATR